MIWGERGEEILYVWVCRDGLWERQAGVQMGRGLMGDFLLVLPVSKLTEARLAVLSWCKSENYVWSPKNTWKQSRLDAYLMSVIHSMKYWINIGVTPDLYGAICYFKLNLEISHIQEWVHRVCWQHRINVLWFIWFYSWHVGFLSKN